MVGTARRFTLVAPSVGLVEGASVAPVLGESDVN